MGEREESVSPGSCLAPSTEARRASAHDAPDDVGIESGWAARSRVHRPVRRAARRRCARACPRDRRRRVHHALRQRRHEGRHPRRVRRQPEGDDHRRPGRRGRGSGQHVRLPDRHPGPAPGEGPSGGAAFVSSHPRPGRRAPCDDSRDLTHRAHRVADARAVVAPDLDVRDGASRRTPSASATPRSRRTATCSLRPAFSTASANGTSAARSWPCTTPRSRSSSASARSSAIEPRWNSLSGRARHRRLAAARRRRSLPWGDNGARRTASLCGRVPACSGSRLECSRTSPTRRRTTATSKPARRPFPRRSGVRVVQLWGRGPERRAARDEPVMETRPHAVGRSEADEIGVQEVSVVAMTEESGLEALPAGNVAWAHRLSR